MAQQKLSQQERIRRAFMKSDRKTIAKKLGVSYQIVFKATNPTYAPASWQERLIARHAELSAARAAAQEAEVEQTEA